MCPYVRIRALEASTSAAGGSAGLCGTRFTSCGYVVLGVQVGAFVRAEELEKEHAQLRQATGRNRAVRTGFCVEGKGGGRAGGCARAHRGAGGVEHAAALGDRAGQGLRPGLRVEY